MAYQSNKPLSTDKLSVSQGDINGNFQAINTYVAIDHVAFNGADQGKHKRVFFTQQAADPATAATEAAIYAKDSSVPGTASLYYRPPNSGTPIEFTYALKAAAGWTWLPSGIIMQWGTGTCGGVIAFPRAFPTACLSVQLTARAPGGAVQDFVQVMDGTLTVNNFTSRSYTRSGNPSAADIYFFAIGY
jgi:hypothetical protein